MSEVPHVALVTPNGGESAGGVEVFNGYLARALGDVETFAEPGARGSDRHLDRVGLDQPYRAWRAAQGFLRRHRDEPFDLVISNGMCGWPLTLARLDVPSVQVYHLTLAGLARHALAHRGDRITTGRVAAFFDRLAGVGKHVVAVSHRVLREVETFYGLRGSFIPDAVDTAAFVPRDRTRAREELGLPPDMPIGIFVGRAEFAKGYDLLLRVARRMPDVQFLAVGATGPPEGNVRPVGRVPHAGMAQWYAASDFFFLPSRYEGFGLALLEGLSCDVPAVVSEAAWPFPEAPLSCGAVVRGMREEDFVAAIRDVLGSGSRLAPRAFVLPRCDFAAFQRRWRDLVTTVLDRGA